MGTGRPQLDIAHLTLPERAAIALKLCRERLREPQRARHVALVEQIHATSETRRKRRFERAQLGAIGGAGFTGFCFGIIIGGLVVDKIGYGKLIVAAFLFHMLSAFITFAATKGQAQTTAYLFLYLGTFVFALANGTLEAVANPLVSTLFPRNRTHYLNILHASWPAGLVLGGLVGDGAWAGRCDGMERGADGILKRAGCRPLPRVLRRWPPRRPPRDGCPAT